ncbi:MAG: 2-oxo acid dehydrogenase subunit E2 [Caldilineaceae bacterium]|nr:2-oxo acid dehydrogenase subunit E2 [Caldilineaceae bacterium]
MATAVKMPQLGESVVEGTIARWLKAPGEPIDKLEPLLEITTDKIDTEIPSPAAGTLLTIVAAEGETVAVGGILAHIGEAGEQWESGAVASEVGVRPVAPRGAVDSDTLAASSDQERSMKPSGRDFISPVVARIAREHDIDLTEVAGTGLGGRVTKKDMLAFVASESTRSTADTISPSPAAQASSGHEGTRNGENSDETLQPLSAMRRAIAQHMVLSKQTSPHVTAVYEVDATAIVRHREANRQLFAAKGITLTYTPYFVAAVAAGLREVPIANSRFTESGIVVNRRIHIGVAVSLDEGLLVPVLRDADEKNLQGLARAVNEVAAAARRGRLAADATQGGTFTITNHGVTGSMLGTPIINQPQSGILGIGTIAKRAVVRSESSSLLPSADDAIVIRPVCYLSFSFDHRVLDGATADRFMAIVKAKLETYPAA